MRKLNLNEDSVNYQFAFDNARKQFTDEQMREFKENVSGITFKEAMSTTLAGTGDLPLSSFLPGLFADEITLFGLHSATARNNFPVVSQASHSQFFLRRRERFDSVQILGEGQRLEHSGSELTREGYEFVKLATSPLYTRERLADSLLDEISQDVALAASRIFEAENRLMCDMLIRHSSGPYATTYNNHISSSGYTICDASGGGGVAAIVDDIKNAFVDMVAPSSHTDAVPASDIKIFTSPLVWAELMNWATAQEYRLLGTTPTTVSGKLPTLFGMPVVIFPMGYYDNLSRWTLTDCDIFLIGTGSGAIRERTSLRTEPVSIWQTQEESLVLSERLIPYIPNELRYRRISTEQVYTDQINETWEVRVTTSEG